MKGCADLAYHGFRPLCASGERPLLGLTRRYAIEIGSPTSRALIVGAHRRYEQVYISSIEPRTRVLHRLYQALR